MAQSRAGGVSVARIAHVGALVAALALAAQARAQSELPPPRLELRTDLFVARTNAVQAGGGIVVTPDPYVRVALLAGGGVSQRGDSTGGSARIEGQLRFLLDPYSEHRLGLYVGGGPLVRWDAPEGWRALLGFIIGVEGNPKASWVPALEMGFGGGARLGISVRRGHAGVR